MRRLFGVGFVLLVALHSAAFADFGSALKKRAFLSPDKAFHVQAAQHGDRIDVVIELAKGIHIYRKSLHFRVVKPKVVPLSPTLPPAKTLEGDKVYEGTVSIGIPLRTVTDRIKGPFTLEVSFQGCSDAGICYQPIRKTFDFEGVKQGFVDKIVSLTKEANTAKIADVLGSESAWFILVLFFIFGLLLALTPCVFPMIPILSSIIVSQAGKEKPNAFKAFTTSLVYVLAMALTYTVVGVVAGKLGADIQAAMQNPWVLSAFAAIFVALALSLFGYYEIGLPASWQSKLSRISDEAGQKGGFVGTAVMGVLSALIVGPCVAPPLGGAVLFIAHTGDAFLGGAALFTMSFAMGVPLLLVGIGAGKLMPKPGGWMSTVSKSFGVMMLALAIFMLGRILPDGVTLLLWALLLMGTALYMGVFDSSERKPGAWKLIQLVAFVFLLYGTMLFVGAVSGAHSFFKPLAPFTGGASVTRIAAPDDASHRGYSIARLMREVKASDKPVVVDFGKASCTACKELEELTFPDPRVKEALKNFTFIRVDVTDNTPEEQALLKKFELFGTPNIIFFDRNGSFLPEKSLTGFIKPEDFARHLKTIAP